MKAINIKWDTDGDKALLNTLPKEITIPNDLESGEEIGDYLSNVTGYCHYNFDIVFD